MFFVISMFSFYVVFFQLVEAVDESTMATVLVNICFRMRPAFDRVYSCCLRGECVYVVVLGVKVSTSSCI